MPYHTILVIIINFISFNCFNNLNWDLSPLDYCWFDYTKTWMFLYFKKNKIFAAVLHFISFQSLNNAISIQTSSSEFFFILNLCLLLQLPPNCYDLFFVSFNINLVFFFGGGVFLFNEVNYLKYSHTIYTFIVQNHASCKFFLLISCLILLFIIFFNPRIQACIHWTKVICINVDPIIICLIYETNTNDSIFLIYVHK